MAETTDSQTSAELEAAAYLAKKSERRRAKSARNREESETPLNIVSMIDMLTTLLFFLLSTAVFIRVGIVDVASPKLASGGKSSAAQDEKKVPQVTVLIAKDGFRVFDATNMPDFEPFRAPIQRCGGSGGAAAAGDVRPTICVRTGIPDSDPFTHKLDYAGLYNHLVKIRLKPEWYEGFNGDNKDIIQITADPEIPFEAILKTMDVARYFVAPKGRAPGAPAASADPSTFLLGDGIQPTFEDLETSKYIVPADPKAAGGTHYKLFPNPVLVAPRASGG